MKVIVLSLLILIRTVSASADDLVKPFKDELFNYLPLLTTQHDGSFTEYDFEEMRDVNGRDEIPVQKAKPEYVEISSKTQAQDKNYSFRGGRIATSVVGSTVSPEFAVIFIHGGGGSKLLGVNDWSFGGNFNRLKNLIINNNGIYFSPTVSFDEQGIRGVAEIIHQLKLSSPKTPVVVACGSAGSFICWSLLNMKQTQLSGLIILGGAFAPDLNTLETAIKRRVPVIFAHGSRDRVLGWEQMYSAFNTLRSASQPNLAKFILYRSGGHGTPIRMIDWRESLNWIFENR